MNIEQANAIPLSEILQKMGAKVVKSTSVEIWYNSPFRNERTASFHITIAKNIWYDFGLAAGGDAIALVTTYLDSQGEDHTAVDALRWLRNMFSSPPIILNVDKKEPKKPSPLSITSRHAIEKGPLVKYLASRNIPLDVGQKYLEEAHVFNKNTGKTIRVLSMRNEAEGYELRNAFFKGCIGKKAITFIRGSAVPATEIHLFEGVMDFLSAVMKMPDYQFAGDVIILNSVYCLQQAYAYIKNYHYQNVITWFDNDTAGESATKAVKDFVDILGYGFLSKSELFAPHKDVNDWVKFQQKGLN